MAFSFLKKLGINIATPGEMLHLLDGNLLFEGSGETALKFKRSGSVGSDTNPIIQVGRIIAAGINRAAWRVIASADEFAERTIFSQEVTGTTAIVSDNTRRSFHEGYGFDGQVDPDFRINGYTGVSGAGVQYEFGRGGCRSVAGQTSRSANVVTVHTDAAHSLQVGDVISRAAAPGTTDANFSNQVGAFTVASVPDTTHFTYSETASNATSAQALVHSTDTDTFLQQLSKWTLACIMGGAAKWITYSDAFVLQSGVKLTAGSADASGTPGAATINEISGKAAIASGASSVVITNSTVKTTSRIFLAIDLASEDATLTRLRYHIASDGAFTVYGNANATGNVPFAFWVVS